MSERIIYCAKLQKEAPGLLSAPFEGDLGREIFEKVSEEAWHSWQEDVQIKVINEYRLNLADPDQYQILLDQMRAFLNLTPDEELEVGNQERGQ
jgi:Fe-S cluster biosynthesis and repair protein YggX